LAADAFGREVARGFGTADHGGAWTISGGAANASVTGGSGRLVAAAAASVAASLDGTARDLGIRADIVLEQAATGGGTFVALGSRNSGATRYNSQLAFLADGRVRLSLVAMVDWTETEVAAAILPGTYTPGTAITLRFETVGTGTTTLRAKAWQAGSIEPTDWQVSATDGATRLQEAGGLVLEVYTSRSATRSSVVRVDNVEAAPLA
jgi:hypothetical protein